MAADNVNNDGFSPPDMALSGPSGRAYDPAY